MDNQEITLLTAFFGGLISFFSPCVLPMLPTYAAFLAGTGAANSDKPNSLKFMSNAALFLAGFLLIFIAMGATASLLGQIFFEYQNAIRKIGALFMVGMGLSLAGIVHFPLLQREYRPLLHYAFCGPFVAFLLGIAFTAGWTPCIGPILATILIYASTTATLRQGVVLLLFFAAGFIVPFVGMAWLLNYYFVDLPRRLYSWLPYIQKLAGIILIMAGLLIYFDLMSKGLGIIGSSF